MRFSSLSVLLDKYKSSQEKLQKSALYALGALSVAGYMASNIANTVANNASATLSDTIISGGASIAAMVGTYYIIEVVRHGIKTLEHRKALKEEASHYGKSISDVEMQYSSMDRT